MDPIEVQQPPVDGGAPPAPAPAPEIPATPPETPKAIDPKDRRDLLMREFSKPSERGKHAQHQPRDNGKFAGPPKFPVPPAAKSPEAVPPAAPVVAPQRPEMPKSLKKELQAHWEAAHPELAAAIHQRELDYEKGVMPLKEKAKLADELMAEFQPYDMMMRAENVTPKAAISEFMRLSALLRTGSPVHKAQTVAGFMRQFGIPLEHVQQMLTSGTAPPQPTQDPQVSQLAQQVEQLKALQEQQSLARVQKEIESFAADPEHKHFAAVQPQMVLLLNAMKEDPEMAHKPEREKLEAAYQAAIYADPQIRQQILAEQQAKQRTEQQIADARNAAVQVTGAPSAGPAPPVNPKDRLALLRNQFQMQR